MKDRYIIQYHPHEFSKLTLPYQARAYFPFELYEYGRKMNMPCLEESSPTEQNQLI